MLLTVPRPSIADPFTAATRPTDVFLCGHPRSGTAWLATVIARLLGPGPADRLVPDVTPQYDARHSLTGLADVGDVRFLTCSADYDDRLPRVVYVVRDPRDVAVSCWQRERFLRPGFAASLAEYLRHDAHRPGGWDEHVRGWLLPERHPDLLVVRHEQMTADPIGTVRRVVEWAGAGFDPGAVTAAACATRFDRAPRWQDVMAPADLLAVEARFGRVMRHVGYAPISG